MEHVRKETILHPGLLDILFAYKSKVSSIFRDVLGIHEISHIAISYVNADNELLSLSSTPALEFNLFNSNLWRYDQTYQADWYQLCTQANWQSLYTAIRYDELYYIKQIKHRYPLGLSLAAKLDSAYLIYSIASHKNCIHTQEMFAQEHDSFYKIGQYCTNMLLPLFLEHKHSYSLGIQSRTSV
ncbi:hypothetical protein [Legionella nagasakiensis]|uniref:hypothetical protein n=1 Tax=Legionella nagasakiensis TaxID=535290 RepID=UPI001A949291|nr:hypothetical protein [Legionella nagasakiensis]